MIGEILKDGTITKGDGPQGSIFLNEEAFECKKGTCYIPEEYDTQYTYADFLRIAKGNEDIAQTIFSMVEWQTPEAIYRDLISNGEIHTCIKCNKVYLSYEVEVCPFCNAKKDC